MAKRLALQLILLGSLGLPSTAVAEEEATVMQRMTLPGGSVLIHLQAEIGLNSGESFEPVSVAPDLWIGVFDQLSLGVITSGYGTTGFWGASGNGACLTGEDKGCPELFDNGGVELRLNLLATSSVAVALSAGGFATTFDPFSVRAKGGLQALFGSGILRVVVAPSISVRVNERVEDGQNEIVSLPIAVLLGGNAFQFGIQSGATLRLEDSLDTYAVPVSAGLQVGLGAGFGLFATFSLPFVATGDDLMSPDILDARTVTAGVTFSR